MKKVLIKITRWAFKKMGYVPIGPERIEHVSSLILSSKFELKEFTFTKKVEFTNIKDDKFSISLEIGSQLRPYLDYTVRTEQPENLHDQDQRTVTGSIYALVRRY